MLLHFALEGLTVCQLLFLASRANAWTSTTDPNQVSFVDSFSDVEHFDNLASLTNFDCRDGSLLFIY